MMNRRIVRVTAFALTLGAAACTVHAQSPRDELEKILKPQVRSCFVIPYTARNDPPVKLEVGLNHDGTLAQAPIVVEGDPESPVARAAVRAFERCAPFAILAPFAKDYPIWKRLRVTFNAKRGS
ncbi:hypothetical protein [Microvirga sp. 17 mud 1-3]|uniref:hypothetical protein n=1 Tax=Microvirga sp. 17 mud 1-3 TaxID=2082949 RepID=UPI000D6D4E2A|nr:hypothetical protein [Microvirga sp. 17 mud 1-3]AWM87423.1 hypothetical protein C4E04_12240 [Microvirga sp. 17 mud 1-3]